jgi:ABC-type uncharacterized transport system permease subunit
MHDFLLLVPAACYLAAVVLLYLSILQSDPAKKKFAILLTCLGLLLHAVDQYQHWSPKGSEANILSVMSMCAFVVVALLVISVPLRKPLFEAGLVALPIATVVLIGEWAIQPPGRLVSEGEAHVTFHILSSVTAFGVLSIASVYALFVALIDRFLRRHHLNRFIRNLPALQVLERLLFQLIAVGFVLLSVSLGSGLLFIENLFEQHLAHKSILSISAWVVFGTLLWGRRAWGWRGRTAVRMTLAGILLLILAYFGSKLVLEVVLGSGWQH